MRYIIILALFLLSFKPVKMGSPQANGLVLSLELDEQGGKYAVDGTGINYCPISGTTFKFQNKSAVFTSAGSDYIDCGNKSLVNFTTTFTISFWFNQATGLVQLVGKYGSGTTQAYRIVTNLSNTVYMILSSDGTTLGYCSTDAAFSLSVWNQVTAVYAGAGAGNSTRAFIYLNGVPKALTFVGTIPTSLYQASDNLKVNNWLTTNYGNGAMRGIRAWNRAFTPTEVWDLYVNPNKIYK